MSGDTLRLHSGPTGLTLNPKGELLQIDSPLLSREFLVGQEQPTLTWSLWHAGETQPTRGFQPDRIDQQGDSAGLWGHSGDISLHIRVNLREARPSWRLDIANHSAHTVQALEFSLRRSSLPSSNDRCTVPYCAGWSLPLANLEDGDEFRIQYPAKGSMQWTSLHTPECGLYFGVHDPVPLFKELLIGQSGDSTYICWRFPDLDLQPGESLGLPPVYLVPHDNGWRGGARIYQSWARVHAAPPRTPDWYAQSPAWAWVGLRGQHDQKIWHTTRDLPAISQAVRQAGGHLIQLTAYTENGHDTLYPDYVPGSGLGGQVGLREAVNQIHQSNSRISMYVNGRLIDPASSLEYSQRQAWGVRAHPGAQVLTERYGSVTFELMCPGASEWRELFIQKLIYLVDKFNIDGIYIDQICGARSFACYASDHQHAKPNQAWSFYRGFLEDLRARLGELKPGLFLATEGVNDLLGQYFDSMQAHNDWPSPMGDKAEPLHDLFRYTFPGHILNSGCIREDQSGLDYLKLAHLSGGGCDFGIWDWNELPAEFIPTIQAVLDWRQRQHETLQYGDLLPGLRCSTGFQANAYLAGSKIIVNAIRTKTSPSKSTSYLAEIYLPIPESSDIANVKMLNNGQLVACQWQPGKDAVKLLPPGEQIISIEIKLK